MSCMRREGFDYIARKNERMVPVDAIDGDGQLSELQFAKAYGFGVAASTIHQPILTSDPNAIIVSRLSPSGRAAYSRALVGSDASGLEPVETSCRGKAKLSVGGVGKRFDDLQTQLNHALDQLDSTPEVVNSLKSWSRCVKRRSGISAPDPYAAFLYIVNEYNSADRDDKEAMRAIAKEEVPLAVSVVECKPELAARDKIRTAFAANWLRSHGL